MATLQGRVALVTGGGRGIGRAIAVAFAAEGAKVAVTARTAEELEAVVADIHARGGEAAAVTADVADRAAVQDLLGRVTSPAGLVIVSPVAASRSARAGLTRNVTSWPASSSRPPKYPPVAPAPTTRKRMTQPLACETQSTAHRSAYGLSTTCA
jgi:hypothetical protein